MGFITFKVQNNLSRIANCDTIEGFCYWVSEWVVVLLLIWENDLEYVLSSKEFLIIAFRIGIALS